MKGQTNCVFHITDRSWRDIRTGRQLDNFFESSNELLDPRELPVLPGRDSEHVLLGGQTADIRHLHHATVSSLSSFVRFLRSFAFFVRSLLSFLRQRSET